MLAWLATAATLLIQVNDREVALDRTALAALPQTEAAAQFHGGTTRCAGPLLADALKTAGATQGMDLRGAALASAVIAEAADDYRVLFSLGELDPLLGNAKVVVALSCGGKPVPEADGPFRLLAGGDQRGARSIRQLRRLRIVTPSG
jgi:hypothetical protein